MDLEKECPLARDEKSLQIGVSKAELDCRIKRRVFRSLAKHRDFRRVYYKGKHIGGKYMVLYYLKKRYNSETRLGVSASKKVGCAVQRNRVRRIIKEAFSLSSINIIGDVVVVAKSTAVNVKMQDVMKEMEYLFNKIFKLNDFSGRYYTCDCFNKNDKK